MPDSDQETPRDQPRMVMHSKKRMWLLDMALLALGVLSVAFVLGLLTLSVLWQRESYQTGLSLVGAGKDINVAAMLAFARAHDFSIVRTNGLFLGFLLVFMGCLYVLRINEVRFNLHLDTPLTGKGMLESSSPGLVLAVLGVALVISVVVLGKSQMKYTPPEPDGIDNTANLEQPAITPIE